MNRPQETPEAPDFFAARRQPMVGVQLAVRTMLDLWPGWHYSNDSDMMTPSKDCNPHATATEEARELLPEDVRTDENVAILMHGTRVITSDTFGRGSPKRGFSGALKHLYAEPDANQYDIADVVLDHLDVEYKDRESLEWRHGTAMQIAALARLVVETDPRMLN